ncbi:hypothetical protein [Streptomyces palmae]|uniref:hypothetical protein n=1 Tax=Streptomyces palmae TaxID=1701085 RepID=UPI001432C019|nr:hypothetical protein [Streptomyces palmae]
MGLGPDQRTTAAQFVEAMRPIAGDNVDLAAVRANLDALGLAVYRTLTKDATVSSDADCDAALWQWVAEVQTWIEGVSAAVQSWAAATPSEAALKAALIAVPVPAAAPASLKARIV